jgi:hypothetical protein
MCPRKGKTKSKEKTNDTNETTSTVIHRANQEKKKQENQEKKSILGTSNQNPRIFK